MQEQPVHRTAQDRSVPTQEKEESRVSILVEYGKTIFFTILVALCIKIFVLDAYRIPSASMENTLLIGDYLLVNKLAYGLRTPRHLPFLSQTIRSFTLPLFQSIHRGDVVIFEFPDNKNGIKSSTPVHFIKRCVGLPGDVVEIRSGLVFVNNVQVPFPPQGIQTDHPTGISKHQQTEFFPLGSTFSDVNYGPIIVPKQGDVLALEPATINLWHNLLKYEGHTIQFAADTILIDQKKESTYTVRQNYYFVLGDNRDNSMDSRFWGFVPDDHLIGEALFVYWSWDPEAFITNVSEKFSTIRWKRIGTLIQ